MRIFLTGHKGLIGSNLLIRLVDLGHEVHYDMKVFDIYKWDLVIHLAATTSIATEFNPMIYENNIIFSKKMLSTPYRTIYASSCSAKYNSNPYAASKIYNEWLGEKHGNAVGLRFHNVYGNPNTKGLIWFLMNKKDGDKITIRGPELCRDFIHVDCVVDEILEWLHRKNSGVFDVGTGLGMMTMDVVNDYMGVSGKKFDIEIAEAGINEPICMISSRIVPHVSFIDGLKKTISRCEYSY
jgi:nucleoside-diphosphate-sugar epimerase